MAIAFNRPAVLIAVPNEDLQGRLVAGVDALGFQAVRAETGAETLRKLHATPPAAILLDSELPDTGGLQLVRQIRTSGIRTAVVLLADGPGADIVSEAGRTGATECVDRSACVDRLRSIIQRIVPPSARTHLATQASDEWDRERVQFLSQYESLFGRSDKMRALERLVLQVADTSATVLIQGETGVGKELVAKAIHYLSARARNPWVKVNCASLPGDLLESELFGHERGAFTGAESRKPGRFELANGGTLLLDEIGEMPITLQSKILHVLQDNEFFRVGGREAITVDVRTVAATNKNLYGMIGAGMFREDLYYRLNVVNIFIPPLRERREEILSLADDFRERLMEQFSRLVPELSAETRELLLTYHWPGNTRELENLIKRYVVLGDQAGLRDELRVRLRLMREPGTAPAPPGGPAPALGGLGLREIARRAAREAERAAIEEVLERVQWNRAEAARLLKISYKTLLAKLIQGGFGRKREKRTD